LRDPGGPIPPGRSRQMEHYYLSPTWRAATVWLRASCASSIRIRFSSLDDYDRAESDTLLKSLATR
jgi:hypothetical protein